MGLLQHAVKVVHSGHSFVQQIIQLMASFKKNSLLSTPISAQMCSGGANARVEWSRSPTDTERVELVSDASGSWGCAAVWGTQWWQWHWNAKAQSWHIALNNFPLLLSCGGRSGQES